ncbi:MAG TPA: TraX family protein [Trueperaceae bacterium]|nr:TraX family protein [Trueperaceae bacterium]
MTARPSVLLLRLSSGQQEAVRWIAIGTMVVDHIGAVLMTPDEALPLRAIGRVAWPLFAFLLAYNVAVREVDPVRYLRPLLFWGALAQLPHYLAFDRFVISILGTLFLAAAALSLLAHRERLEQRSPLLVPGLLVVILLGSTQVEYGPVGVGLVLAFWWALREGAPLGWLAAVLATALANQPWPIWPFALIALPLPFVAAKLPLSLPRSGRLPWLFYPAHLALLAGLDRVM